MLPASIMKRVARPGLNAIGLCEKNNGMQVVYKKNVTRGLTNHELNIN
jgi:hypothetical protein